MKIMRQIEPKIFEEKNLEKKKSKKNLNSISLIQNSLVLIDIKRTSLEITAKSKITIN